MAEFEEIFLSGGTIEFKKGSQGGVSNGYTGANPWPTAVFQVCVSYDGRVLDTVPFGGIGQVIPYPQPSLIAWVISDRHGMFGRRCSRCKSYFRTDRCPGDRFCPYCGYAGESIDFLTDNQLTYIANFCKSFLDAYNGDNDVILDLDKFGQQLPENKPKWLYAEEQQQNRYTCDGCRTTYDVLGEYALCPCCGKININIVFERKITELEEQFRAAEERLTDRHEREVEWEKLTRCVSEFESMANQVRRLLLRFPATPQRRAALRSLSFQRILNASARIQEWYGFDILEGVSDEDRQFLNRMFNRRHVFTHNAGCVDQEYLDNTGDSTVKLNQALRVRSKELRRLIPLVRAAGQQLIQGYDSVQSA